MVSPRLRRARRARRAGRAVVLVLALLVGFVQTAWAHAAACGSDGAQAACRCCKERAEAPRPIIASDCCAISDRTAATAAVPTPGPLPAPPVLVVPTLVAATPMGSPTVRSAIEPAAVEVRAAGPPLWLRTLVLRL